MELAKYETGRQVGGLRKIYRVVKLKTARVVAQESEKPVCLKQEHCYRKKQNNENDC